MSKANTRYVQDITLNQPGDLIQNVVNDWLNKNSYSLVTKKGETFYETGDGIVTAKNYLSLAYTNGVLHIESWIKVYGKEISVADTGFAGIAIKKGVKTKIDDFVSYLSSQSYVSSVTSNVQQTATSDSATQPTYNYTETVNVKSYDNPKAATAPLVVGIVVLCVDIIMIFANYIPGWLLILASIYGIVASSKAMKLTHNSGKSIAALVLNILATIFSVGLIIYFISAGILLGIFAN